MRHNKKGAYFIGLCLLILSVFLYCLSGAALALDEEAENGYAADTLTVRVGYFGGVYEETRTFTADELWAMNVVYTDYTLLDNMPSVVIDHVAGIPLADIIEAAGIDLNSVQSFNFWTKDKTGSYYTSLTKTYLIDTPRYCYYSLPDNFDYDMGTGNALATSDRQWVPTVIALADDWNRALAGASFGSDYSNLNTSTRFRLIFGQTNAEERTASRSAKWIYAIEVTLGGAPPQETANQLPDGKVGSEFTSETAGSSAGSETGGDDAYPTASAISSGSDSETAAVSDTASAEAGTPAASETPASAASQPDTETSASSEGIENTAAAAPTPELSETLVETPETAAPEIVKETPEPTPDTAVTIIPTPIPSVASDIAAQDSSTGRAAQLGYEIKPVAISESSDGGVQQWRKDEMADDATELPEIYKDAPITEAVIIAAFIFICGGTLQIVFNRK